MLLLLYVSGDLSGLFRSRTLWSIYKLLDDEVLGEEISTDSHDKNDGPEEGVGYAAHIGGRLVVHYFFALNLFEAATASSCLGKDDFVIVIAMDFENSFDFVST
jgi:hypothetical protein